MQAQLSRNRLARAWAAVPVRSRIAELPAETLRQWLKDLPPAHGYAVLGKPLRYRVRPHLSAACWYDDRLIELQLPKPFKSWAEPVYYRAKRRPGQPIRFRWFARQVRFRNRREVIRFLYCHEFYHWYLKEIRGTKAAAETACDRFALAHFRSRNLGVDWAEELPGYLPEARRPLRPAA